MPKRGLLYNLGAFFGHVEKAIHTDVTKDTAVLKHEVTELPVHTDAGPALARHTVKEELHLDKARGGNPPTVTARRTTVEEVIVKPPVV